MIGESHAREQAFARGSVEGRFGAQKRLTDQWESMRLLEVPIPTNPLPNESEAAFAYRQGYADGWNRVVVEQLDQSRH